MIIQFSKLPILNIFLLAYKKKGKRYHANILNSKIMFGRTIKHKVFSSSNFPFSSMQARAQPQFPNTK